MKNYPDVGKKIVAALPVIALVLSLAAIVTAVGPCTTLGTRTTVLGLCKPAQGEVGWDSAINGNFDTLDALFQSGGFLRPSAGGFGFNASTAANGRLPIGNGTGFTLNPLTAGAGIVITPGAGSIQIASSGSPAGGSIFNAGTLAGSGGGTDYSTTSATFVDVDSTNLKVGVTVPAASKFLIVQATFSAGLSAINDGTAHVRFDYAGSSFGDGVFIGNAQNASGIWTLYGVLANPTPGSGNIALQFRGDGSNAFVIRNQAIEGVSTSGSPNFVPLPFVRARMQWMVTN